MNKLFVRLTCLMLLAGFFSSTLSAGKIVRPWRSTTAIAEQGGTFEIWWDADNGQNLNSVQLRSDFLTVNVSHSTQNGDWEYDFHSGNRYDRRITVTVPANTPADRYELLLNTSNGQESSTGAVKVVQQYRDEYYVAATSCAHRWQGSYDGVHTLRKVSEILKIADILDVQLFMEAGDNMYNVRNNPDREVSYFHGIPSEGIIGVHSIMAATFMTAGNHEAPDNTADSESGQELGEFYNDYYGMHIHNTIYGNGRYLVANNGWGGGTSNLTLQGNNAKAWLDSVGWGNMVANVMHIRNGSDFFNRIATGQRPVDFSMVGHNHFIANQNPSMIGNVPQYIADSVRDLGNFEFNLFRVNNNTGAWSTPSGVDSRCQVVQNDSQALIADPSQWISNLQLDYQQTNDGSSTTNTATITNNYHFAIEEAKIRFIMPLGNTYAISSGDGFIRQAFDGDSVHVVDVAVDVSANSNAIITLDLGTPSPNNSQFVSQSVPTSMDPGETVAVSITMKNTGTDPWSVANGQDLGSREPPNNTMWTGSSRVNLTQTVAPDANYTFNFNITAPATPGLYDFRWQMVDDVAPETGWFGGKTPNVQIQVGPPPIRVQAEDFSVNQGFQTQSTSDVGGGLNIGWTDAGDYLEYNLNLSDAGLYNAVFRTASPSAGANLQVSLGATVLATVNESATGDYQTWETSSPYQLSLPSGNVTLRITALGSSWNFNWFELQFIGGNIPPQITSTPSPLFVNVGGSFSYTLTATDLDSDPLSFSSVTRPNWLTFNTASGLLSGVPGVGDIGPNDVTLRVNDGTANTDQSFTIQVSAAGNDVPVITSTPGTGVIEGDVYSYTMAATDADGDTLTFSSTDLPGWLSLNSSTGVLSGTPGAAEVGNLQVIQLSVTDGEATVDQNFNIMVFAPPAATNLILNSSFEDGGANPSFWTLGNNAVGSTESFQNGSSSLKVTNNSSPTVQVVALEANTEYEISAWVLASGLTTGSVVIDTNDVFDPGMIPGGDGQFVVESNEAPVWTRVAGIFNSATETSLTVRIFGTGTASGVAYVDNVSVAKTTATNVAPVFTSTPVTEADATEAPNMVQYYYQATAADAEGDTLTFSTPIAPAWLSINPNTGVLTGTTPGSAGTHNVTIQVSDGTDTVNQPFTITINATTDPAADDDGDGVPYILEVALGGNPNAPDADLILPEVAKNGNNIDCTFNRADAGTTYVIEKSTDLQNWSDHVTVNDSHGVVGTDATVSVPDTEMVGGKLFLRLRVDK